MEELAAGLFGFLICLLLSAGLLYSILYFLYLVLFKPIYNQVNLLFPLKGSYRKILEEKFSYYNKLSAVEKKDFEFRLKYFLQEKYFFGEKNLIVTDEMKVLVGATAVQITFGFHPLQLPSFNKIILYPKAYYTGRSKRLKKGEVNSSGAIIYSWEDFLTGYQFPEDGINLALHEIAHAVKFEDFIYNSEYAFLDDELLLQWHNLTIAETKRIKNGENTFIRAYAATNKEEFFAVCVEHFFEQPTRFKTECPELYATLAQLLKQDPLRTINLK